MSNPKSSFKPRARRWAGCCRGLVVLTFAGFAGCSAAPDVPVSGQPTSDVSGDDGQLGDATPEGDTSADSGGLADGGQLDSGAVGDGDPGTDAGDTADLSDIGSGDVAADIAGTAPGGLWWRQFGAPGNPVRLGPNAIDSQGRTIVAGGCNLAVDLGVPATLTGTGVAVLFVAAYAADGTPLWARRFAQTLSHSVISDVVIDSQDRIYLIGHFQGGPVDFGSGPLVNAATSGGSGDIFVAAFDANGKALWSLRDGSPSHDFAGALAIAPDGWIAAATQVNGHLRVLWLTPEGKVAQAMTSPNFVSINAAFHSVVDGVAIDSNHHVYVAGTVSGAAADWGGGVTTKSDFQQGFVASYAAQTGTLRWLRTVPTTLGNSVTAHGVEVRGAILDSGALLIAGDFPGQIDLGKGPLVAGTTFGAYAGFVASLRTKDGVATWALGLGEGSASSVRDLGRDHLGRPVITAVSHNALKPMTFLGKQVPGAGAHLLALDGSTGALVADRHLVDIGSAALWDTLNLGGAAVAPGGAFVLRILLNKAQIFGFAALKPVYSDGLIIHVPQ